MERTHTAGSTACDEFLTCRRAAHIVGCHVSATFLDAVGQRHRWHAAGGVVCTGKPAVSGSGEQQAARDDPVVVGCVARDSAGLPRWQRRHRSDPRELANDMDSG